MSSALSPAGAVAKVAKESLGLLSFRCNFSGLLTFCCNLSELLIFCCDLSGSLFIVAIKLSISFTSRLHANGGIHIIIKME